MPPSPKKAKPQGKAKVPMRICPRCEKEIYTDDAIIKCPQCERMYHESCGFQEKICHFCQAAVEGEDADFTPELDEADETGLGDRDERPHRE